MIHSDDKGLVFNIQRYSIHDGDGIRTLVFMKGCPLRCIWCSNPEAQSFSEEMMHIKNNCIKCGKCTNVCPVDAINPENYDIDKQKCTACGTCAKVCYANAKKKVGKWYSVDEIINEIEKDRVFFRSSQGGVTVGGGEPTAQPIFVKRLLKECKQLNMHTAIETCGHEQWSDLQAIFENVDQVFFDLKHMNDDEHIKLTGVTNRIILENAKLLAQMNKEVIFRLPLIPGYNNSEENILQTGRFVKSLMTPLNDIKIEILLYHNLGAGKYESLGREYGLMDVNVEKKEVKELLNKTLSDLGCNVVK